MRRDWSYEFKDKLGISVSFYHIEGMKCGEDSAAFYMKQAGAAKTPANNRMFLSLKS